MRNALLLILSCATLASAQQSQLGRPPAIVPPAGMAVHASLPIRLTSTPSWIDTTNRATVVNAYFNTFVATTGVLPGWTGNILTGDAGSTTATYQNAVLARINYFRQLAGVPTPISFSTAFNSSDQQAALMMSANAQLNHMPPTSWQFYSAAGATAAANSNLCLEYPYLNDPGCVAQYMQDAGANNFEAGHRRWLLYPQTQNMGTGDVQPAYPAAFANALYVIDSHYGDARPLTRDNFVAWPSPGYIPAQLVPGRWSFCYPGADFTNAVVTMQRGGGAVTVRMESPQTGYGENGAVWVPDNIDATVSTHWPVPVADTPIGVTVSHVSVAGVDTSFHYTVTVIDPSSGNIFISGHVMKDGAAMPGVSLSLSGGPTAVTDANGGYSFGPVAVATYTITPTLASFAFSPASITVSAASTTADFTTNFCDYSRLGGSFPLSAQAGSLTYNYAFPAGCPWTGTSNASWLTVSPLTASGTGPMNLNFSFLTNHQAARTAALTISGRQIGVTQASAGQGVPGPLHVGFFYNGLWALDSIGNGQFTAGDRLFNFQIYGVGDTPVVGDWNGDGNPKAGVYHSGFWALDYNNNGRWDGSATDRFYAFGGNVGEIPVVGDWNGDGRTKVGYYNKGFWALDYNGNGQWDGTAIDRFCAFGGDPAAIPVVGDWNGDGRTKIGYYLHGLWVLDYNGNGVFDVNDKYFMYTSGSPNEIPVVGDWNGSGTTKVGLYRNGFWTLNTSGSGSYVAGVDIFSAFGGNVGEIPMVGDWNGDGRSKVGYVYHGFWALDWNGNGRWDGTGAGQDKFFAFGGNPGEYSLPAKW